MTVYGSAIALSLVACVGIAGTEALVRPLSSPYRVIVSPSVAEANYLRLGEDLDAVVRAGAEWLHFPVQDGRMVPHITIGPAVIADCRKAFPNTIFDVKLSCIEPEHLIDEFVKAGADIISVHPEATSQVGAVIDKIQQAGCTPGIILNPGTSVSSVEYVLDQCQVAVVMLENPGYGGPLYINKAIHKIKALRAIKPDLHIAVDGGVSPTNAQELIEAGATVLVVGEGLFKAHDKKAAIDEVLGMQHVQSPLPSSSAAGSQRSRQTQTDPGRRPGEQQARAVHAEPVDWTQVNKSDPQRWSQSQAGPSAREPGRWQADPPPRQWNQPRTSPARTPGQWNQPSNPGQWNQPPNPGQWNQPHAASARAPGQRNQTPPPGQWNQTPPPGQWNQTPPPGQWNQTPPPGQYNQPQSRGPGPGQWNQAEASRPPGQWNQNQGTQAPPRWHEDPPPQASRAPGQWNQAQAPGQWDQARNPPHGEWKEVRAEPVHWTQLEARPAHSKSQTFRDFASF